MVEVYTILRFCFFVFFSGSESTAVSSLFAFVQFDIPQTKPITFPRQKNGFAWLIDYSNQQPCAIVMTSQA